MICPAAIVSLSTHVAAMRPGSRSTCPVTRSISTLSSLNGGAGSPGTGARSASRWAAVRAGVLGLVAGRHQPRDRSRTRRVASGTPRARRCRSSPVRCRRGRSTASRCCRSGDRSFRYGPCPGRVPRADRRSRCRRKLRLLRQHVEVDARLWRSRVTHSTSPLVGSNRTPPSMPAPTTVPSAAWLQRRRRRAPPCAPASASSRRRADVRCRRRCRRRSSARLDRDGRRGAVPRSRRGSTTAGARPPRRRSLRRRRSRGDSSSIDGRGDDIVGGRRDDGTRRRRWSVPTPGRPLVVSNTPNGACGPRIDPRAVPRPHDRPAMRRATGNWSTWLPAAPGARACRCRGRRIAAVRPEPDEGGLAVGQDDPAVPRSSKRWVSRNRSSSVNVAEQAERVRACRPAGRPRRRAARRCRAAWRGATRPARRGPRCGRPADACGGIGSAQRLRRGRVGLSPLDEGDRTGDEGQTRATTTREQPRSRRAVRCAATRSASRAWRPASTKSARGRYTARRSMSSASIAASSRTPIELAVAASGVVPCPCGRQGAAAGSASGGPRRPSRRAAATWSAAPRGPPRRRFARRRVPVGDEQPGCDELVGDGPHRRELAEPSAPPRVGCALAGYDEPAEQRPSAAACTGRRAREDLLGPPADRAGHPPDGVERLALIRPSTRRSYSSASVNCSNGSEPGWANARRPAGRRPLRRTSRRRSAGSTIASSSSAGVRAAETYAPAADQLPESGCSSGRSSRSARTVRRPARRPPRRRRPSRGSSRNSALRSARAASSTPRTGR